MVTDGNVMLQYFKGIFRNGAAMAVTLIGMLFTMAPSASEIIAYEYDEAGRLVKTTRASDEKQITYNYDDADNRTSKTVATAPPPSLNEDPECQNASPYLGSIPSHAPPVSFTLQDSSFLNLCSDPDGDALTLLTPSTPYSFTVSGGQTVNIHYTVSDGNGGTGSGTYTFARP